jgi:hypothetical protein
LRLPVDLSAVGEPGQPQGLRHYLMMGVLVAKKARTLNVSGT